MSAMILTIQSHKHTHNIIMPDSTLCNFLRTLYVCTCSEPRDHADFEQYVGPSISLGDTLLQWTGPPLPPLLQPPQLTPDLDYSRRDSQSASVLLSLPGHSRPLERRSDSMIELRGSWMTSVDKWGAMKPLNFRVLFEGETGSIATSSLDMKNCGTTVVYFSWVVGV